MASELFDLLVRLSLAAFAASAAVLLLRRPFRAFAGPRAAYSAWLAVPVALAAACLPSMRITQEVVVAAMPTAQLAALSPAALHPASLDRTVFLLGAWLGGALALATLFAAAQRRFVARLGRLERKDGIWIASTSHAGPALVGLFKPRIVVPADFAARYDDTEQALIIAHEERHAARADPLANALAAALQCAFWFNPLAHYAAARFRFDQELACDADVMRRLPSCIKSYAAAMLKTQVVGAMALATCHWQSNHPLKERIMNLHHRAPAPARRLLGRIFVAGLLCLSIAGTVAARADTAADGPAYEVALDMELAFPEGPGAVRTIRMSPRLLVHEGKLFAVRSEQGGLTLQGEFWISDAGDGRVSVRMKLKKGDKVLGEPSILAELGARSAVAIGPNERNESYKVTMTVKRAPEGVPGA